MKAPQTSLPCKALPYWHLNNLFDTKYVSGGREEKGFFFSVWTYPFVFPRIPPNLKLAFKRQTVNVVWIVNPLFNGRELENVVKWSLPSKIILTRVWKGLRTVNCLRNIFNSGVKSINHVLEPLDPDKEVPSNQPNFCIDFIYIVWRKMSLLGLWFTVLVCTRCCLQKNIKKEKKHTQVSRQLPNKTIAQIL